MHKERRATYLQDLWYARMKSPENNGEKKEGRKVVFSLGVQSSEKKLPSDSETILQMATRGQTRPTVLSWHCQTRAPGSHRYISIKNI